MPDPHHPTPCGAGNLRNLPVGPTPGPLARGAFPAAGLAALALPPRLEALVADLSGLNEGQLQIVIAEALRRGNKGPLGSANLLWQMALDAERAG